jgi:acetyl esterase/lipase
MATIGTISRGIEPATRSFLEKINASKGPQIYQMSPANARNVLSDVQAVEVSKMPVDVEEKVLPVGPGGRVNVHIARPKGSIETLPVIMYYHGGGWVLGDYNIFERPVGVLTSTVNAAVVFVDYSRSPEAKYPVAIEQDYAALEYVAAHGKELNVDTSRLAIAGDSVGGNMTAIMAMLAKQRNGPKIAFQVLFYPVTDASFDNASYRQFASGYWLTREAMKWFWDNYLPDTAERKSPMASPLQASVDQLKGLPPALVITNEYDVLRDEGEAYAHKLMDAGVPTTGVRLLGTIHDMVMLNALAETPAPKAAMELACGMLQRAFAR